MKSNQTQPSLKSPTSHDTVTTETNLVFVYGTLKRGFHNHRFFKHNGHPNGAYAPGVVPVSLRAQTVDPYPMVVNVLPFLLPRKGAGFQIGGEVYSVSPVILRRLDGLEGHPHGAYRREVIPVRLDPHSNESTVNAWCYFFNPSTMRKLFSALLCLPPVPEFTKKLSPLYA